MKLQKPEYIFESSWEVCNLVGGIYTVLSTRAATLKKTFGDKLIFVGPDVWHETESPYFEEMSVRADCTLPLQDFQQFTEKEYGLKIRIGRWKIAGEPISILVDFQPLFARKNEFYSEMWASFGVNSIAAYGDYDEASMFALASAMVIESYYKFFKISKKTKVIAHFNEWTTSFGILYIKKNMPQVATVFTTHATSIGRSIAGNGKPLYGYLREYNGDQMAYELNMVSKHSTEKTAAHLVDCFTTVSEITARECVELLDKQPDIVTPNGFENDFVPKKTVFPKKRKAAREILINVAEKLLGYKLPKDILLVGTAGRYEYKNKGIDVFIESLKRLQEQQNFESQIVAFIMTPAHIAGARASFSGWNKFTTHELYDYHNDQVMNALRWFHFTNNENEKIKIIFVPSYLNGADGIFNKTYYDLLIGLDLTVFPSYYEPWGYTPLESVAFSVPTITTDLSGFGRWVSSAPQSIETGVGIAHRSDYNAYEVATQIAKMIAAFVAADKKEVELIRQNAAAIAEKALWEHFIKYYYEAYSIALGKRCCLYNKLI